MKTLILSDIHGNLPAIEAILEREREYDACLFLGDVVDYGPFPKECIHYLIEEMDMGVMGNHDNAIAFKVDCGCHGDLKRLSSETRAWHTTLLGKKELQFLKSLHPLEQTTIDGLSIFMAHATPEGDLFRYLREDEVGSALKGITTQLVLLGHTHIQFKRQIGDAIIVNPGSVGLARDGEGSCYAILDSGMITLHRIPYDVERTVKALRRSPISEESKKGLENILRGHNDISKP